MIRTVIISPDHGLAELLVGALEATGQVAIARVIDGYPPALDLLRSLRAAAAELLFVSFQSIEKAHELVKLLETEGSNIPVVAFHHEMDAEVMRETMRAGLREFLVPPFDRKAVMDSLLLVKTMLDRQPVNHSATNQIYSFLPSKAGVGTSTIAVHVSAALARRPNTNVLISDFDLNSGMLRFMLKLNNTYSVTDAIERSIEIDENLWPQLVTRVNGLDVLHAGRLNPNYRIDAQQVRGLIGFMRRNYQVLTFDLSGNLERYSLEIMQESKRVLLVCTPEVPSLHLAREKLSFLRDMDLHGRVSVILNRTQKKPLFTKQQVEDLLGVPVIRVFPNDYFGINRAVTAGELVPPASDMGKEFAAFADILVEQPKAADPAAKRKFVEFFSANSRVPTPKLR